MKIKLLKKTNIERLVVGVDPGMSGALVAITLGGDYADHVRGDDTEDDQANWLRNLQPRIAFAIYESVHSMPKQGVASSFTFGSSFGFLRGILSAHNIRRDKVTPQKWQTFLKCKTGGNKNISKRKAQELFPKVKVTHQIADALLLAEYARQEARRLGYS